MFDSAINSKPAFEGMGGPQYGSFQFTILDAFSKHRTTERAELLKLFKTGTVDNFIEFAENNFTHVPKADTVCVEGKSAQRYFVLNADELTKIYDVNPGVGRILVPQYGFIAEVNKDKTSGAEIFKNISFFVNDITVAHAETLTSARLEPYDAGMHAYAVPPALINDFGLYRIKI